MANYTKEKEEAGRVNSNKNNLERHVNKNTGGQSEDS